MFYACLTLIGSWEGGKNLRVEIFLNKKLVRVGLQETNNFLGLRVLKSELKAINLANILLIHAYMLKVPLLLS